MKLRINTEDILDKKLTAIVEGIKDILKPVHYDLRTEIEESNGSPVTIGISVKIKLR